MTLEVNELSVSYGDKNILEKITFQINPGQIIGLVAPNGTGKTTLFNAMMRFIPIKSGQLILNGKEYTASSIDVLELHRQMTFFPDQGDLLANFSGREHIQMYADVWSKGQKDIQGIIQMLEMESYADRKTQTYSLGMKQRLCFAMMVAADTPVMLMDEVMNGLDPENVSLVSSILLRLKKDGKIIMVSSHLLDNLDEYADKVFFLKDKKLHHITDWHQPAPDYFKALLSPEKANRLEAELSLPEGTLHLGNNMLCIPVQNLNDQEQQELFRVLRGLHPEELSVGPLGTSEYYSYIYSLPVRVPDRREEDVVQTP